MKIPFLLVFCVAIANSAQAGFRAYAGTESGVEGGTVEKLTVVSDTDHLLFNVRPPAGWTRQMDADGRRIVFTSASGRSALTIQFTTNSPGALPEDDILRAQVLEAHPGAGIVQRAVCPTSYQPGVFFDLTSVPSAHLVQKARHAFVAGPAGEVEFVLSSSEDEFDAAAAQFMDILRDFSVTPAPAGKS